MSDAWVIVLTAIAGVATGVLSGMFGVGGATISTPAIRAIGAAALPSVGSTLPSIFPSAISGTYRYWRAGLVDRRTVLLTASAGIPASVGGALLADVMPGHGHPLMLMTAALVGFSAYRLGSPARQREAAEDVVVEGETDAGPGAIATATATGDGRTEHWRLALIGLGAGGLSGLLGIGGGLVMVPAFTGWARMPIKAALGTSLACVGILAIPGTITHAAQGNIDWLYALPLCIGVVPGAQIGSRLAIGSSDRTLRLLVGTVLGIIAISYAVGEILSLS